MTKIFQKFFGRRDSKTVREIRVGLEESLDILNRYATGQETLVHPVISSDHDEREGEGGIVLTDQMVTLTYWYVHSSYEFIESLLKGLSAIGKDEEARSYAQRYLSLRKQCEDRRDSEK